MPSSLCLSVSAGIALARRKGRWTIPYLALIFVILGIPELVSAIGQMIWLDRLGIFNGITRLSIGHSLFNIAVVTLIVRARAEGIGETLEQAAADLGAPPWRRLSSTSHYQSCSRRCWPAFCSHSHCRSTMSSYRSSYSGQAARPCQSISCLR